MGPMEGYNFLGGGFKSDWNDKLCCLSYPFSPLGCAGEVQMSSPQGCNGGGTARDIDSAGIDVHRMWELHKGIL